MPPCRPRPSNARVKNPVVRKVWLRDWLLKMSAPLAAFTCVGWKLASTPRIPICQPTPRAFQNGIAQLAYWLNP